MLKKWLRKFHKKREKTVVYQDDTNIVKRKTCLCLFSVSIVPGGKTFNITLNEDENLDEEKAADKLFESKKKEGDMNIFFFNYKSNILKTYNKTRGIVTKTTLKPVSNYPVDFNLLYTAIEIVASDYENHQLPPKYFSIIYKLLKDKVLGTGYDDVKATTFRQKLMNNYKTEGKSSFSKYLPKGVYPNWYYEGSQFTSNKKERAKEALDFAEKFKKTYDNLRFSNIVNPIEEIETAE